ncbi:type II secretion system GspH family protein [Nisaea acidiphila]|uniref:Type II secretion system GspH family protein n=1 Tax=Nisaea acidiphila TaxID=1862145 RepID=A0A9J7AN82_9PROT|nr:type II secretion system protein [Nisaea acidiphila]UUX48622.1 type II secretion system GspH family protein [Nisaea acidiphila]
MSRDGGFSLLETLVGLTLIALVATLLAETLGAGIFASSRAGRTAEAMSAARSVLAELGVSRPLHSGELTGDLDGGGEWTATVTERGGTDSFISYDIALAVRLGGAEIALDAVRTLPVGVKR